MNDLKDRVKVNKRGILLISTLFFVLVLIMMSVALFALTRANYADMKSFYSENEAINNAESAINIAAFIIASQPSLLTINSDGVNLSNLGIDNNTNIVKRINSNNYRICVLNLKDKIVISNDSTINNNFNRYFNVVGSPSKIMVALVISPRNRNLTDSGAILFFGNNTGSSNTYKNDDANAVGVNFDNRINFNFSNNVNYPNISGISYPLYTSVNNANNDVDITGINGYRNANKYTVLLMAMGYSKVPNTNRYVVRYVDQKLANGGLLSAALFTGGNASFTTSGKLYVTSNQVRTNRLIANNFTVNLVDNNNPTDPAKTVFSLLSNSGSSDVVGKLVATTNNKTSGEYTINGQPYTLDRVLNNENGILDTVKTNTKGTVENKQVSFNFDNTYNNFKNAVNSAVSGSNTYTLNAGWYIFKDNDTIYYYPPDKTINDIIDGGNLKNPGRNNKYEGKLKDSSGNVIATISNYSINFNQNINVKFVGVSGKPNFVFITSFKPREGSKSTEKFGTYDVNINLDNNIFLAENLGVVIDGAIKGEGTVSVTGDGSAIGATTSGFKSFKYYDTGFFQPYNPNDVTTPSLTNSLKRGTLVTQFDYLKSSSNKVAILVDNDMYINPTFKEVNTAFMDYLLMESLKQWVGSSYVNFKDGPTTQDKADIFQIMAGFADQEFKINGQDKINGRDINLFTALFYSDGYGGSNSSYTLQLEDGDFKDYKLNITKSYKDYILDTTSNPFNLNGSYNSTSGTLTISYGSYSVNINVDKSNPALYTFSYNGKTVQINDALIPTTIKNVMNGSGTTIGFTDFAVLWYAILRENPKIANSSSISYVLSWLIKNNLEGLYNEYKTFLSNNGLKNDPKKDALKSSGGIDQSKIDKNYFAWIDFRHEGLTIGQNAASKLGSPDNVDVSYLDKVGNAALVASSGTNSKIEGMLMVKGKLQANTGDSNLTFRGLALVKSDMNIKSKDTTFFFDLNSIDVNLLAGSVITLVPVLYRQESVISK